MFQYWSWDALNNTQGKKRIDLESLYGWIQVEMKYTLDNVVVEVDYGLVWKGRK
jgi:hypothetical protein